MVVRWLVLLPNSKKARGLNPSFGLSVWSLYVLPVIVWVFFPALQLPSTVKWMDIIPHLYRYKDY